MACTVRYNMPLLETIGMTSTSKNFTEQLWLSTCHGDLYTVFVNIDSFIEGQIADIKSSLDYSRLKEKFNAKSNSILKNISKKISHLALKKIWTIQRLFWRTLKIDSYHPCSQEKDMDMNFEMRDLANLLDQISIEPIFKVKKMRRLAKEVLSLVLPEDPSMTLTSPPEVTTIKGRWKTNSTKRHESYWEHVSIAHRKIKKSSGSGSNSGSGSDPSPCSIFSYIDHFPDFEYPFIKNWKNVNGDGNCGYRVEADFVFGDEYQWHEEYHHSDQVSSWAEAYSDRIVDWNMRYAEVYPPRDPIHVY
ncbi:hypothetical protein M9H77_19262 [Catharanthus roseus]|uniref:Uncharacterized protein n=1 Tax=Catharanthus roseus TaxID=4058 RepID=A0ACC0B9R6_CATRO|nr:hypothetical protein M9H77_19262 [Catharanthus roseus]